MDIHEEKTDLNNARYIAFKLRDKYNGNLVTLPPARDGQTEVSTLDPDVRRRRTQLSLRWPGDEFVAQIIKDAAAIMAEHDIDPGDVRF